jgi:outer membrane protein assembly factor BamB
MKPPYLVVAVFLLALARPAVAAPPDTVAASPAQAILLEREWELEIGRGFTAAPVSIGAKLLALTTDGWAAMIDCMKGEVVWRERRGYGFDSRPLVTDSLAFMVSEGNKRSLTCLSLSSGRKEWSFDMGGMRAAPLAVPAGLVILETGDVLGLFRTHPPSPGWSHELPGPCLEEMHAVGDNVLVACGDSIVAFDARNGERSGSMEAAQVSSFLPLPDSGILIMRRDGELTLVDAELPQAIWSARVDAAPAYHMSVEGRQIYISSGERLSCFGSEQGELLWQARFPAPPAGAPCVFGDLLALATLEGKIRLLSPVTGEVLSTLELGEPLETPPVVCVGTLVAATRKGRLIAFRRMNAEGDI